MMASKILVWLVVVLLVGLVIGSFTGLFFKYSATSCLTTDYVNMSIVVNRVGERKVLGFDLGSNQLTFGTIPPLASSRRTVTVEYTTNTTVTVSTEGDFSSWVNITPQQFLLHPGEQQEVAFEAFVPAYAFDGKYFGRAVFCYRKLADQD